MEQWRWKIWNGAEGNATIKQKIKHNMRHSLVCIIVNKTREYDPNVLDKRVNWKLDRLYSRTDKKVYKIH